MKPLFRVLTAVLAPLAVLVLAGAPAAAHGGEGVIEVTSITRSGPVVTVDAHLRYVEDGHGVPDATVTVVVDEGTPIPMDPGPEEGDYTAAVPAPPGAAIRVTSVEPATTVDAVAPEVDDTPTTTEAAPDTTEEGSTTTEEGSPTTEADSTTSAAPDTTEADDDEATTTPTPVPDEGASDDDGGISPIVIGAIVAVVLAAVVMAVILLGKRTPPTDGSGSPTDEPETDEPEAR